MSSCIPVVIYPILSCSILIYAILACPTISNSVQMPATVTSATKVVTKDHALNQSAADQRTSRKGVSLANSISQGANRGVHTCCSIVDKV